MSRPRLGIDIDDVLSQTNVFALQKIKTQHAIEWQYENIIDHSWETLPGFPLDAVTMFKFWDLLVQGDDATENILPIDGSIEAITTLAIHYELHAITARKESAQLATEIWLKKHFKNAFNSITFIGWGVNSLKKTKWEACVELGVAAMVEDHMSYAITVAECGIPCYLMPRPWNLSRREKHPLVLRRQNWSEVTTSLLNHIQPLPWKSL